MEKEGERRTEASFLPSPQAVSRKAEYRGASLQQ